MKYNDVVVERTELQKKLQETIKSHERMMQIQKNAKSIAVDSYENKVNDLMTTLDDLQERVDDLTDQNATLMDDKASLEDKNQVLETKIDAFEQASLAFQQPSMNANMTTFFPFPPMTTE